MLLGLHAIPRGSGTLWVSAQAVCLLRLVILVCRPIKDNGILALSPPSGPHSLLVVW